MKEKDTEKQLKALEEAVRQEQETGGKTAKKHRESSSAAAKESHPLASFLIGLVLLGAGIFWVLNSFVVSFSCTYSYLFYKDIFYQKVLGYLYNYLIDIVF